MAPRNRGSQKLSSTGRFHPAVDMASIVGTVAHYDPESSRHAGEETSTVVGKIVRHQRHRDVLRNRRARRAAGARPMLFALL